MSDEQRKQFVDGPVLSKAESEKLFNALSDDLDATFFAWVDREAAKRGLSRRFLAGQAGKAMIMLGCSYVGNAIGATDAVPVVDIGRRTLQSLVDLVPDG